VRIEFSVIEPVNSKFGFSVSGALRRFSRGKTTRNITGAATQQATGGNYAATTVDVPYLTDYLAQRVRKSQPDRPLRLVWITNPRTPTQFRLNFAYAYFFAQFDGTRSSIS